MKGLMSTINAKSPTWILEESLIGVNPGLGFRPMPAEVDQGSLIWYDASNQTQISEWTSILDDFMEGPNRIIAIFTHANVRLLHI